MRGHIFTRDAGSGEVLTLRSGESLDLDERTNQRMLSRNVKPAPYRANMPESTIRVLVVEDHKPFRQFVRSTLEQRAALQIVGEVSDGLEAVQRAQELKPDLIILDIGLPSLNGIEAARRIRSLAPESKIIFFSQEFSDEVVREALCLGAWGYVAKARAESDLLAAVDAVLLGWHFISGTGAN